MRQIYFLLILFFVLFKNSNAQSPGGISANNTLWLRSDIGVTSASGAVTQWQDLSGANVTGNFTVQPLTGTINVQTGPTEIAAGINFNPFISFNGNTNSLSSLNAFTGTSLVTNNNVTVFQVVTVKGGIVWLKWETDQVGSTARLGFENAGGRIRFDFPKSVPASAGQNVGVTNVLNLPSLSTTYADATVSINRLNGATDNTLSIPGPGNFAAAVKKIVLGNEDLINLPAQVDMAELIIYSSTLTALERNKIESYLAVKYGFTLNQVAVNGNDYRASDETVIWNRAANSGYANNITGIGRDDASGLNQKQSKSVNTNGIVTIGNGTYPGGTFPSVNSGNVNSFSIDKSFLLFGDDGGTTNFSQCIFGGKIQKIQRVWKVSKTSSFSNAVTISVPAAAVPALTKTILVSADPTFPEASTTVFDLLTSGTNLYRDIVLTDNVYFTFATSPLTLSFAITDPTCTNINGGGVVTTATGGNTPITYLWTPSAQTTPDLVNVASGSYSLTTTHGGCQLISTVNIAAPPAPVAPTVNAVSVCDGSTALLSIQNPEANNSYQWYDVLNGGTALATGTTFTTPIINGPSTFYVETTIGSCTSVRVPVVVSLTVLSAPAVSNASTCNGGTVTLSVLGAGVGNTYNWYDVATGGTAVGTGNTFTTPPMMVAGIFYVEAINGTCVSIRTAVTVSLVTVVPPIVNPIVICNGTTGTLTVLNIDPTYTYNWFSAATVGSQLGTGSTFTSPVLTSSTTYYVESMISGCASTRIPVVVNIQTVPAPVVAPVPVCSGNVALLSVSSPVLINVYSWYTMPSGGAPIGTGISISTPVITSPATYYVEASDGVCSSIRVPVAVTILPPLDSPRVVASTVTGSSITFSWPGVTGAIGYEVSVNGGPYLAPSSGATGTIHTVTGLSNSQNVSVRVKAISPPQGCGNSLPGAATATTYGSGFYVPSAFTPNNDNLNDNLIPVLPGGASLNYFTVFNRWGQKVFSTTNIGMGWNGKLQGVLQSTGNYVWICSYKYQGKMIEARGSSLILQ